MTVFRLMPLFLLLSLAGCSGMPRREAPTVVVSPTPQSPRAIENSGEVCFYTYSADSGILEGVFYPKGCYSSSCTRIIEQGASATVDEKVGEIRILSRFVLLDTTVRFPEPKTCSADCNGGGEVRLIMKNVTGDHYKVVLGAETIGVLNLSEVTSQYKCFGPRF